MSKEVRISFSQTVEEPCLILKNTTGEEAIYSLSTKNVSVSGEKIIKGGSETDSCSISDVISLKIEILSGEIGMAISTEYNNFDVHLIAKKEKGNPIPRPIDIILFADTADGSAEEIHIEDVAFSFKAVSIEDKQEYFVEGTDPASSEEAQPITSDLPFEAVSEDVPQTGIVEQFAQPTVFAGLRSLSSLSNSPAFILSSIGVTLALIVTAIIICIKKKSRKMPDRTMSEHVPENLPSTSELKDMEGQTVCGHSDIAALCNIGGRSIQQDNFCILNTDAGILAVIADGMGGLQESHTVSSLIIQSMKSVAGSVRKGKTECILYPIAAQVNDYVCNSLGSDNLYKSGSTFIAVLVEEKSFQWISVGDSRLYLYRAGEMLQLNREHIYFYDLLRNAVNRNISFKDASEDENRNKLTSFIGMGNLSEIDGSIRSIALCPGDTLILMTDGVFNSVSEENIRKLLSSGHNMKQTAQELEQLVLSSNNSKQDNFTAVLIHNN